MLPDWLGGLPSWLVGGFVLGVGASILVAGAFVAGAVLLPAPGPGRDGRSRGRGDRTTGHDARRAEIRDYFGRIDEPFEEDARVAGRRVAFLLPARDVAVTFDAKTYFRLQSAGVRTVLCEHEMPGWTIGRRLPFETPTVGPDRGRSDSVTAALAELGLEPDADVDVAAVRAAYRERAKEVHPDQGGDEAAFRRLRNAYAVARSHAAGT